MDETESGIGGASSGLDFLASLTGNTGTGGDELGSVSPIAGGIDGVERDALGNAFDPERHSGLDKLNADGGYRLKRGRRATGASGKTSTRSARKTSVNVNAIETALVGIHMVAATMLRAPEIALEKDESEPLAKAVAEVAKHYDVPHVADVVLAWVSLGFIALPMYGAKAVLVKDRVKAEKAKNVTDTAENVMHFNPNRSEYGGGFPAT